MRKRLSSFWSPRSSLFFLASPRAFSLAEGKTVGPPEVAWKDMTFAQKKAYMKAAVEPTMKPIFQAFDAKKFKTVRLRDLPRQGRRGAQVQDAEQ